MNFEVRSPFPFEDLPRVHRWIEPFRSKVSDDFGPQTLQQFMEFATAKWDKQQTWGIYSGDELGGLITFERLNPWIGTAHWITKPGFQGRGITLQASRIALSEMFETGVGKVGVYPLAGNLAIGSLLASLGFRREGTLIEQTLVGGKPTDVWVYGLTKSQFEVKNNAMGSSNTSTDRGGVVNLREPPVGEAEDHHHDQHADAHAADAADDGQPALLR